MSGKTYLKDCTGAMLLLPFIDEHYDREDVIFRRTWLLGITLRKQNLPNSPKVENVIMPLPFPRQEVLKSFGPYGRQNSSKQKCPPKSFRGFKQIWSNTSKRVARKSGKAVKDGGRRRLMQIPWN